MTVKLLTEHHLEFLCIVGCCTSASESTHVKMPYCWKYHVAAQLATKIYIKDIQASENKTELFCDSPISDKPFNAECIFPSLSIGQVNFQF